MFQFFTKNNLTSHNQSAFKPSDSCINQFLLITHELYKWFDNVLEILGVYLDISKVFDNSVVCDVSTSINILNSDLSKIDNWTIQ